MRYDSVGRPSPVRVLCVAANRLQAGLLAGALDCHSEVEKVGVAVGLDLALQHASDAEVVVLQAAHLADGGVAWVAAMTDAHPTVRLIVVDVPRHEELVVSYVEAGAFGCVTEDQDLETLLRAIEAVQRGEGYLPPELVPALLHRLSAVRRALIDPQAAARRLETLTPREHEILGMLCQGDTNGAIAGRLHIAVGTVKNHVHNILRKLHASGRWEAAACLEIAGRGGCLDQVWPLAWGPWPASEAGAMPVKVSSVPNQAGRLTGYAADDVAEAEDWAASWPDA